MGSRIIGLPTIELVASLPGKNDWVVAVTHSVNGIATVEQVCDDLFEAGATLNSANGGVQLTGRAHESIIVRSTKRCKRVSARAL